MGQVPSTADRRPLVRRRRIPRSRVPLRRRLRRDPAAIRHWLLVAALAWVLASLVGRAVSRAEDTQQRWGRTVPVWVVERPLRAGDRLQGTARRHRWPAALVPRSAVDQLPPEGRAAGPVDAGAVVTEGLVERDAGSRRTIAVPRPDASLPVAEGDRVDVWATADPATTADGTGLTRRVASGARVAAASSASVVLEVDPAQVDDVAAAGATATITLVGVP